MPRSRVPKLVASRPQEHEDPDVDGEQDVTPDRVGLVRDLPQLPGCIGANACPRRYVLDGTLDVAPLIFLPETAFFPFFTLSRNRIRFRSSRKRGRTGGQCAC